MKTERELSRCVVKESAEGEPYLWFDLFEGPSMPSFPDTHFGLDLNLGTTYDEASELAAHINKYLVGLFALKP